MDKKQFFNEQIKKREDMVNILRQSPYSEKIEKILISLREGFNPELISEIVESAFDEKRANGLSKDDIKARMNIRLSGIIHSLDRIILEGYLLNQAINNEEFSDTLINSIDELCENPSTFINKMAQDAFSQSLVELRFQKETEGEIERLKEAEEKSRKIIGDLQNQNRRLMEDYSALRKRVEREKEELSINASLGIMQTLIPIMENFHHAMMQKDIAPDAVPYMQGMAMIERGMWDVLGDAGLKSLAQADVPFDPELHEAVLTEEGQDNDQDMVAEILRPGYIFKDKMIRHAKVKVHTAKKIKEEENKEKEENKEAKNG